MASLKKSQPSEHNEQVALVSKLRKLGHMVFAIPNGGKRGEVEGRRMKEEGLLAGVPDLSMPIAGGRIIWIELKTRTGGTVSAAQKAVHARLRELGHPVIVGRGAKDAFDQIMALDSSSPGCRIGVSSLEE